MKKILSIGVVLLFIGVGFAPSLFADVETISEHQEFVELTVEFYGLDETDSYQVTVTREDSYKLDSMFDEVRNELNNASSNSERVSIFNDCIVELDKLGLLAGNSVEEVQRITTGLYQEEDTNNLEDAEINNNCLIVGRTTNTSFFYPDSFLDLLFNSIGKLVKPFLDLIKNEKLKIFIGISIGILIELYYQNFLNPIQFGSTITYGKLSEFYDAPNKNTYADGWVWTFGKNGVVEFDGGRGKLGAIIRTIGFFPYTDYVFYYIGAKNFRGIRLVGSFTIDGDFYFGNKYIGFASEVSIG